MRPYTYPPPRFARRRESASPPIWWCYGRVKCLKPFSLLLRRRNTRSAHSAGDPVSGGVNCRGFEILLFRGPENSNPLRYLTLRCWRQHRKLEPFALFDFSGPRKLDNFALFDFSVLATTPKTRTLCLIWFFGAPKTRTLYVI